MNPPLPEVFTADLDTGDVERLIGDVLALTTILGVTLKDGARRLVAGEEPDPAEALRTLLTRLREGHDLPPGAQLRYRHGAVVFYDTLMRRGAGWRLTRIAPPHDQDA